MRRIDVAVLVAIQFLPGLEKFGILGTSHQGSLGWLQRIAGQCIEIIILLPRPTTLGACVWLSTALSWLTSAMICGSGEICELAEIDSTRKTVNNKQKHRRGVRNLMRARLQQTAVKQYPKLLKHHVSSPFLPEVCHRGPPRSHSVRRWVRAGPSTTHALSGLNPPHDCDR